MALGIETAGKGVLVTGFTMFAGLAFWWFSFLRFQAEMAQLLSILMVFNMIGAITIVPAFFSVLGARGMGTVADLTDEQREALRIQREMERKKGPIDYRRARSRARSCSVGGRAGWTGSSLPALASFGATFGVRPIAVRAPEVVRPSGLLPLARLREDRLHPASRLGRLTGSCARGELHSSMYMIWPGTRCASRASMPACGERFWMPWAAPSTAAIAKARWSCMPTTN